MRVIAGKYRSRPLRSLPGLDVRPTADRLRETLFNILTAGNPQALEGSIWFDLYAGTGAVGIEAISRGAEKVYLVESSPTAADLIKKNVESLGIKSGFEILKHDVSRTLRSHGSRTVAADFIFLDPPYRMEDAYRHTLTILSESQSLKKTGMVIAEIDKRFEPGENYGSFLRFRRHEQGDAALSFYKPS